jgi:hypothetical protein
MDVLQQLVRKRQDHHSSSYYDRPLTCGTPKYSSTAVWGHEQDPTCDDDASSSSDSFSSQYSRFSDRVEPNSIHSMFEVLNETPFTSLKSHKDDESSTTSYESHQLGAPSSTPATHGGNHRAETPWYTGHSLNSSQDSSVSSDFSETAFRRRRKIILTTPTRSTMPTTNDVVASALHTTLLQKCRSTDVQTLVHRSSPSALLLSERRFQYNSARDKYSTQSQGTDEAHHQSIQHARKGNDTLSTRSRREIVPRAHTDCREDDSGDASFSITEGSLGDEASQVSEASIQLLFRHLCCFEATREEWYQ